MDLPYVNFEQYAERSDWRPGQTLVPPSAKARVARMNQYLALFNGAFVEFIPRPQSTLNFWAMSSTLLANVMLTNPPEFEPQALPEEFYETLIDALYTVIVDMTRYGTGVFRMDGLAVEAVDPRHYYPLMNGGYALAYDAIEDGSHVVIVETFDADGQGDQIDRYATQEHFGNLIGEHLSSESSEAYIVSVARRPAVGDWGKPLYDDITSMGIEYNRRMSQISELLTEHGNPKMVLYPDGSMAADRALSNLNKPGQRDTANRLRLETFVNALNNQRNETVITLPAGYGDLRYLQWQGQVREHLQHAQFVMDNLFAATNIPASLYGFAPEGSAPTSGVALRLHDRRTRIYIKEQQDAIIPALYDVNVMAGAPGVEIVWANEFDLTELTMDDGGEERSADDEAGGEI